jgi:sarcosine oxidase subunit beta
MKSTADVVIIGAGVIGCSTAYHLAARGFVDVAVVEMGQVGSGSTSKSAAMLSLQFCHDAVSAAMAQRSYAAYRRFEEELGVSIDFKRHGWLSVAQEAEASELLEAAAMLNRLGIATEVLDPAEIKRRYPEIRCDDLAVGTFGPDDGPFDPHMIVWGYARRAMALGAKVYQGVAATGFALSGGRVAGVHTTAGFVAAPVVVNAAGPWAAEVGRWAGGDVPILNRSRTILVTGTLPAIPADRPFVEDVSAGWYYRPEGDGVLMGMGEEPVKDLIAPSTSPGLVDAMIDAAVHRVPALEQASILTTWTGVRPLTPDGLPILGADPRVGGLVLTCGWGGVGIIMAPIAGLLAAEIIATGRGETVDCDLFRIERFG